jgi:hypothetical protein
MRPVFVLFATSLLACPLAGATPTIDNHDRGSEVRYPVVLLRGAVAADSTGISVENASSDRAEKKLDGAVSGGRFKVLAELVPGENKLTLSDGVGEPAGLVLNYKPQANPYYVRVVWMTDKDGDTTYPTMLEDDPQNYAEKLSTMATLLQTFTAERMHDKGYGRRTFRLERDEEGDVVVHKLATPQAAEHYYAMGDQQWWREIAVWLNRTHADPFAKNLVIAAYTRKDPETGKLSAHTALGGGSLGLFGGASVFSWPDSLADVVPTFRDNTKVDPTNVHDDSAGRGTIWALASTTMGAVMHEMGHTFGLPHCTDRWGIMTRGFDYLNRGFTFADPPSRRGLRGKRFTDDEVAYFAPISAAYLQWSLWFQLDEPTIKDPSRPELSFDAATGTITVKSGHGVRWVGLWQGDNVTKFKVFDAVEKQVSLSKEVWKELLGAENLSRVSAMAGNGAAAVLRLGR